MPGLLRIEPGAPHWGVLEPALAALEAAAEGRDPCRPLEALVRLVPDYQPPEPLPARAVSG